MKARQPNFPPVVEVGYIEALLSALSSVSPWKGDKHFTILSDWNTDDKNSRHDNNDHKLVRLYSEYH